MALNPFTPEQAAEFLASQHLALPGFVRNALIDSINAALPCMEGAGYTQAQVILAASYLLALNALSQGARVLTSRKAPSGAAETFGPELTADRFKAMRALLKVQDPNGCLSQLVPADTSGKFFAGMWVAGGGCYE